MSTRKDRYLVDKGRYSNGNIHKRNQFKEDGKFRLRLELGLLCPCGNLACSLVDCGKLRPS